MLYRNIPKSEAAAITARLDAGQTADRQAACDAGFRVTQSGSSFAFVSPKGQIGPWVRSKDEALTAAFDYWANGGE